MIEAEEKRRTVRSIMLLRSITSAQLAGRIGKSEGTVNNVIQGSSTSRFVRVMIEDALNAWIWSTEREFKARQRKAVAA